MSDAPYVPLECSLHDRLEEAATLKRRVVVRYRGADGEPAEETAAITDIVARNGAEYMTLSSGAEVRLDLIVSVDGVRFAARVIAAGAGDLGGFEHAFRRCTRWAMPSLRRPWRRLDCGTE